MKRIMGTILLVVAAAMAGSAVGSSATGQSTGGTLGPGAVGTLEFSTVQREAQERTRTGINPRAPRDKTRPAIADLLAGNSDVVVNGERVGVAHHYDVTTFRGPNVKKYKGGARFIFSEAYDFGNGDVLFATCVAEDAPTNNPCAVTGGTGRFAGARGSLVQDYKAAVETGKKGKRTFTLPHRVTFIP